MTVSHQWLFDARKGISVVQPSDRCGVIIANTGTPEEPTPPAVRAYLRRFLMDKRIAPMNRLLWWLILQVGILPRRGQASAQRYQTIWTDEGSPFMIAHEKLAAGLDEHFAHEGIDAVVRCAMSYGAPLLRTTVRELKASGCTRLVVLPLYPQSALSTTGSVSDGIERALKKEQWDVPCDLIDNYHDNPTYARALAASIRRRGFDPDSNDKVLFSYHSIPLADIEAGDTYELQTGASSLLVASELGLERTRWTISYQSRFDNDRDWLSPFTTEVLARWAEAHTGRVFFVCPGFSVDCLETLYDIERELKPGYLDKVREAGRVPSDDEFVYVPCLDRTKAHVKVLADVLRPHVEGGSSHA